MKLVVGLGNIGLKYKWTRHNVGFEVIEKMAYDFKIELNKSKFKSMYGEKTINGEKVILAKPLTCMNLSGQCIREFLNYYKDMTPDDIIIICDDVNLNISDIRIRTKGSDGGQNGLKNIIHNLDCDKFARVRVGVGKKPPNSNLAAFVLSKFNEDEDPYIIDGITKATKAICMILENREAGFENAMNKFNRKVKKEI